MMYVSVRKRKTRLLSYTVRSVRRNSVNVIMRLVAAIVTDVGRFVPIFVFVILF